MSIENSEYVGFWVRTAATLVDTLLLMLVVLPLLLSIYGLAYFDVAQTDILAGWSDFLITWIFPAVAVVAFWVYKQATPGKMLVSATIVDATSGDAPSVGQCIGRYLAYFVSIIPLGLGLLWVAFDSKKQGWHDKLAGTLVVRSKRAGAKQSDIR